MSRVENGNERTGLADPVLSGICTHRMQTLFPDGRLVRDCTVDDAKVNKGIVNKGFGVE